MTLSILGLNVETLHASIYPWALHVAGSESWLPRVHLVTHQSVTHSRTQTFFSVRSSPDWFCALSLN